jgi:CHAT domain-containing protein
MYSKIFLATSRFMQAGLLLSLLFVTAASGQSGSTQAQLALWDGDLEAAIKGAQIDAANYEKKDHVDRVFLSYDTKTKALIALARYPEAEATISRTVEYLRKHSAPPRLLALTHLTLAESYRSERKIAQSIDELNKALQLAPLDLQLQAEYNLGIGRTLFKAGYDMSAILWLEKAEKLFDKRPVTPEKLDTYRFLALAWSAKLNYSKSLEYFRILADASEGTVYKSRFRQALLEYASALNASGQKHRALATYEKGLRASLNSKSRRQARNFLSWLLLDALYNREIIKAKEYHRRLTELDSDDVYLQERLLGEAVIHAFEGRREASDRTFRELEKIEKTSEFLIPNWKIIIAENSRDWEAAIGLNNELLDLIIKSNFREDLPRVYLSLATAYFHTNRKRECLEYLEKSISLIEEILASENGALSLGLSDTFHTAYRLLTQIHLEHPQLALHSSDYLKGRILKDRIDGAMTRPWPALSPELRKQAEKLSTEFIRHPAVSENLEKFERSVTMALPSLALAKVDLTKLNEISGLENVAVVSYLFAPDGRLIAFVWEKGKAVKSVELRITEVEFAKDVENAHRKIKNFIFFKRDGKELFDQLLKPLNASARHLIIVPDKHIWKVPFQALSPDGEKYLIEDKLVSYVPSLSILLEQLMAPKPTRRTLQAFANPSYNNQFLQFVNDEARSIAGLFNSRPVLNATISDFRGFADKADVLHFAMHAQVDNDQPLDSFLAFKEIGKNDGRLRVEDILNSKLKKGSLVFLASCDTNNVLSGEGLVSLAWGMMGAGATTVISAQWEASDKLTGIFTQAFYRYYKQGFSSAEALQKASLEMIKNKSSSMHEPYYWADFTLNGDFR